MAGEISKNLVARIRDLLGDQDKRVVKNDMIIYQYLSGLQDEFMRFFNTTYVDYEIPITSETEYDFDVRVKEVVDIWEKDDDYLYYRIVNRKIVIMEGQTGTIVYRAFIVPATHAGTREGELISDDITKSFDPIIGTVYHKYLIDGVLSYFSTKERPFKSLKTVYEQVEMTASSLMAENKVYARRNTGRNIMGVIQI
jgi:hypothetical protein